MKTLPLSYEASKNAWITSSLFEAWFHQEFVPAVRKHLRRQKLEPNALLLLDNCPAHPDASSLISNDGKIRVSYLPKNTTSRIQPLDQGIISVFKVNYRRELVKKPLTNDVPVHQGLKAINIKEMVYLADPRWDAITPTCIENCWMKALDRHSTEMTSPWRMVSEPTSDDEDADFEGFTAIDLAQAERKLELCGADLSEWYTCDNDCPSVRTHIRFRDSGEHIRRRTTVQKVKRRRQTTRSRVNHYQK